MARVKRDYKKGGKAIGVRKPSQRGKNYKKSQVVPGVTRTGTLFAGRFMGANSEYKFHDTLSSFTSSTNFEGGSVLAGTLNGVAQGTEAFERVGNKITVKSVEMRVVCDIHANSAGAATGVQIPTGVRVLLVLDKQANGAAPAFTDVLTGSGEGTLDMKKIENSERFVIIRDFFLRFSPAGVAHDGTFWYNGATRVFKKIYKRLDLPIDFGAIAGTVGSVRSNNLVLLAAAKHIGSTAGPSIDVQSRIRYTDN